MSSFAGVSIVSVDDLHTTPAADAGTDSGYHLLVVKDYSSTVEEIHNGEYISSGTFMVGGHQWCINYYPNGDLLCADFFSLYVSCLDDNDDDMEVVEAKLEFSFVDQVEYQKPTHIHATETFSFSGKDSCWGYATFMKIAALEQSAHLKADCFTIRCDIIVCNDSNSEDADVTMPDIGQQFNNLLQNKVGADVTFEVSGETFVAHRCVLAARSTVFMAELFGSMKEGTTSSVIQIKDMRAEVFAALLKFIYTDSFPKMEEDNYMEEEEGQEVEEGKDEEEEGQDEEDGQDEEEGQEEQEEWQDEEGGQEEGEEHEDDVMCLQWLKDLLVAADMYDLQRLNFLCGKHLSKHIGVSSVASLLALAEQHHCHGLKEACFKFIQVQSPKCLDKIMATDGWEHMSTTYPSVFKGLVAKLVSSLNKDKKRKLRRM